MIIGAAASTRFFRVRPGQSISGIDDPVDPSTFESLAGVDDSPYTAVVSDPNHRDPRLVNRRAQILIDDIRSQSRWQPRREASPDELAALTVLVLEGIVEVESVHGFVTGADAIATLGLPAPATGEDTPTGRLSMLALRHALRLEIAQKHELAARLYFFNRIPRSRAWIAVWPDRRAVLRSLGRDVDLLTGPFSYGESAEGAWAHWRRRDHESDATSGDFKLYVSAHPADVSAAFGAVARTVPSTPAHALKIGLSAGSLLRPDKIVVYFTRRRDLVDYAATIHRELNGARVQGVPFSGALDDTGLLSWGFDPPAEVSRAGVFPDRSWRIWLCNRLASAIAETPPGADAIRFALTRAAAAGVDTADWAPVVSS